MPTTMIRESENLTGETGPEKKEKQKTEAEKIIDLAENINTYSQKLPKENSLALGNEELGGFEQLLELAAKKGYLSKLSPEEVKIFQTNRKGVFALNKKIRNREGDVEKLQQQRQNIMDIMQRVIVRYNPKIDEIKYFRVKLKDEERGGVYNEERKNFEPINAQSEKVYNSLKDAELRCRREKNKQLREMREVIKHNKEIIPLLKELNIEDLKESGEKIDETDIRENFEKNLERVVEILLR